MMPKYIMVALFLFLLACSSGKKSEKATPEAVPVQDIPVGARALFDGQSLDGWDITNFGTQGPVRVSSGKIIINMGDGCSGITFRDSFPRVNYEVGLEARKTAGNDFFCGLTFPVNEAYCSLVIGGWGGPVVGLSTIDGRDASENETRSLMNFEPNVWYAIRLTVSDSTIVASIDKQDVVRFNYTHREIDIRPEVSLSKPFGLCTWMTTAEIRNFWMREL